MVTNGIDYQMDGNRPLYRHRAGRLKSVIRKRPEPVEDPWLDDVSSYGSAFVEHPLCGVSYFIVAFYRPYFAFTQAERHPVASMAYGISLLLGLTISLVMYSQGAW